MREENESRARGFDVTDAAVLAGLLLLGWALWLTWGQAAVLAYAGTVLVIVGMLAGLRRQSQGKDQQRRQE
jgi:hypothetical protein